MRISTAWRRVIAVLAAGTIVWVLRYGLVAGMTSLGWLTAESSRGFLHQANQALGWLQAVVTAAALLGLQHLDRSRGRVQAVRLGFLVALIPAWSVWTSDPGEVFGEGLILAAIMLAVIVGASVLVHDFSPRSSGRDS
jgi:hypothetical protein